MKKTILIILSALLSIYSFAQNIERNLVVIEIATGTWCGYCPGMALAADEFVEKGDKVAVIEYHNGDNYANKYSNARNSYYQVKSFPTANFDGQNKHEGGDPSQSIYNSLYSKYTTAIETKTVFDLSFSHRVIRDTAIVEVIVDKLSQQGGSLVLHSVITESHISKYWQGLYELNFVARSMFPDEFGSALDFSSGNKDTIHLKIPIDSDWDSKNCELVVFVQDRNTHEIHNAAKDYLDKYEFANDATLKNIIIDAEGGYCGNTIAPKVNVKNTGFDPINTMSITYSANNGGINEFIWQGSLESREEIEITLDAIAINLEEENVLNIQIAGVNGSEDAILENNEASYGFTQAATETNSNLHLELKTDTFGNETKWKIVNSEGDVLYTDGPYEIDQSVVYNYDFYLPENSCYKFIITDESGDGLDNIYDGAYFLLKDSKGNTILNGDSFTDRLVWSFELNAPINEAKFYTYYVNDSIAVINQDTKTVEIVLPGIISEVKPVFDLSVEASVSIDGVEQISGESTLNLNDSREFKYDVISGDESVLETWTVKYNWPLTINEIAKNKLSVYPVPFTEILNIENIHLYQSLVIINVEGKIVINKKISESSTGILNVKSLPAGIYTIMVTKKDNTIKRTKVVKF